MHETALIRSLLRQVAEIASDHSFSGVQTITIRLGRFAGYEPALVALAFEQLVADTCAASAQLEIIDQVTQARCVNCQKEFTVSQPCFDCPSCGRNQIVILEGDGVTLESVTLTDPRILTTDHRQISKSSRGAVPVDSRTSSG